MWHAFGPFTFQSARILHYAAYFLMGMIVGSHTIESGLLSRAGKLARNWFRWTVSGAAVFLVASIVIVTAMTTSAGQPIWSVLASFMFVLSCAASSLGVTAIFVRFFAERSCMWESLASNAYGIYLVHYVFVNWLQYALLNVSLPGLAKGMIATLLGLGLSWTMVAVLRRIPAVARLI
jgi:surface polysaccharide O-acyltransferase-like enzyme